MDRYEYMFRNKLCKISNFTTCGVTEENQSRQVKELNRLGLEGWEMCGNISNKTNAFIFKRKIKEG